MNHILAASFGAAFAVALVATFSPVPSAAWAFWALLGGVAGYLAQDRHGFFGVCRLASRALRRSLCKVYARARFFSLILHPFGVISGFLLIAGSLGVFRTIRWVFSRGADSSPLAEIFSAGVATLSLGGGIIIARYIFRWIAFAYHMSDRRRPAYDERYAETNRILSRPLGRRAEKNWDWDMEYRLAVRREARSIPASEIGRALAIEWAEFLGAAVALPVMLCWGAIYGFWVTLLSLARVLHTEARLAAGAGASLGAMLGLTLSVVWDLLWVPVLAVLLGAACGALCGWVLSVGSSKVVARFGVATD